MRGPAGRANGAPPVEAQAGGLGLLALGLLALVLASPLYFVALLIAGSVSAGAGHGLAFLAVQDNRRWFSPDGTWTMGGIGVIARDSTARSRGSPRKTGSEARDPPSTSIHRGGSRFRPASARPPTPSARTPARIGC